MHARFLAEVQVNVLQPPLRAGSAYEDIADALQAGRKRGVAEDVATRVSELARRILSDLT